MSFTYEYERPAVTVDAVVFGYSGGGLSVLLIRRGDDPFKGMWALPGGFLNPDDQSLAAAAHRELGEETGVKVKYLEQLGTFGDVGRDPRDRVVTVAYYALVPLDDHVRATAASDAAEAKWVPVEDAGAGDLTLAFDHTVILDTAILRLRAKVQYMPIGFNLLPEVFTMPNLQRLYETILDRPLDKRNFRRRMLGMKILRPAGKVNLPRPTRLYRFDRERYERLVVRGFQFET